MRTKYDYFTGKLNVVDTIAYSDGEKAKVRCYGADDVREGVAIMQHESVDVSITGNSTIPRAFSIPLPAPIRNGLSTTAKIISRLRPAAARAERFIPTTWRRVPRLTA